MIKRKGGIIHTGSVFSYCTNIVLKVPVAMHDAYQ